MENGKTGVYLCKGCGIGDAVSVDDLEKVATGEFDVPLCRQHDCLCSEDGVKTIAKDIGDGTVDRVVIAACSHRVMTDRFDFADTQVTRANLREQVVWTHPPGEKNTQMMAADNVRMAIAQAANSRAPQARSEGAFSRRIMVVGGGVSGLTAAREISKTGHEALLVERSDVLGGWARKWTKRIPHRPPYRGLQANDTDALITEVAGDPMIIVMTDAQITKTEGMPGNFTVHVSHGGTERVESVGAIVVATGWRPYDPTNLGHLGYGASPDVVTNVELEAMLASGAVTRKSDGRAPKAVAFIQCAGSRDPDHLPYCSSVCCGISIKHALQLVEADPEVMAYILYDELRTPGTAEEFYRQAQEAGVIFMKGKVKSVDGDLTVTFMDELLGMEVPLQGLDMVVLATGMVPNSTNVETQAGERGEDQLMSDINPVAPIAVAGYMANSSEAWPRGEESAPRADRS